LVIAAYFVPLLYIYDINTGTVTFQNASASKIALDRTSDMIYMAGGSITTADITDTQRTSTTLLSTVIIRDIAFDFVKKVAYFTLENRSGLLQLFPPFYYRSDLDGKNKMKFQIENSFNVPNELTQFTLVNGKFYATYFNSLDTFNIDGSGYTRIIQSTYVTGTNLKYDAVSQHVYWQEEYGSRLYSCAVYSNKYGDCVGINLFPDMMFYTKPQITDFAVGTKGMIYLTAFYEGAIYTLDMKIGQPSFKRWVKDPRLYSVGSIVMDKARQTLFVSTTSPTILQIALDGTVNMLYSNITSTTGLLVTDFTGCK